MRRIALSLLAVLALMTASYADVVDATHPTNVGEVDALLRRIEQLERRIRELESRPHVTQSVPRVTYPPPRDGVLRADQVQIYMHYQMPARDVQTADKPPKAVEPATFQFRSGGITIVR